MNSVFVTDLILVGIALGSALTIGVILLIRVAWGKWIVHPGKN